MKKRAFGTSGLTVSAMGIGFVPYSPLGKGFLTAVFTKAEDLGANDFRSTLPRFTHDAMAKNYALVEVAEIEAFASQITIEGERYTAQGMAAVGR